MILLSQNSSRLTLSCHHFVMHYTGYSMACSSNAPSGRLILFAHGIMFLLSQDSSQLTLSCHHFVMHNDDISWLEDIGELK